MKGKLNHDIVVDLRKDVNTDNDKIRYCGGIEVVRDDFL